MAKVLFTAFYVFLIIHRNVVSRGSACFPILENVETATENRFRKIISDVRENLRSILCVMVRGDRVGGTCKKHFTRRFPSATRQRCFFDVLREL